MFEYIFYTEMNVFLSLNYMSIGLAFDIYIFYVISCTSRFTLQGFPAML